jgi:MraZ protein
MLRGNFPAKVDEKFRLRLPAIFLRQLPETTDNTYFVTSIDGECAKIYPIPVWERIERKIMEAPQMDPAIEKLTRNYDYYGHDSEMDPQGRILIPQKLREKARLFGDVLVMGKKDHLEVWNEQKVDKAVDEDPLTFENRKRLAELGI